VKLPLRANLGLWCEFRRGWLTYYPVVACYSATLQNEKFTTARLTLLRHLCNVAIDGNFFSA